jgi:hypothetical protein
VIQQLDSSNFGGRADPVPQASRQVNAGPTIQPGCGESATWKSALGILAELLGARSRTHNELFSYLFFAREFIDALIELGAADARAWLAAPPGPDQPWQLAPLDAFVEPDPSP